MKTLSVILSAAVVTLSPGLEAWAAAANLFEAGSMAPSPAYNAGTRLIDPARTAGPALIEGAAAPGPAVRATRVRFIPRRPVLAVPARPAEAAAAIPYRGEGAPAAPAQAAADPALALRVAQGLSDLERRPVEDGVRSLAVLFERIAGVLRPPAPAAINGVRAGKGLLLPTAEVSFVVRVPKGMEPESYLRVVLKDIGARYSLWPGTTVARIGKGPYAYRVVASLPVREVERLRHDRRVLSLRANGLFTPTPALAKRAGSGVRPQKFDPRPMPYPSQEELGKIRREFLVNDFFRGLKKFALRTISAVIAAGGAAIVTVVRGPAMSALFARRLQASRKLVFPLTSAIFGWTAFSLLILPPLYANAAVWRVVGDGRATDLNGAVDDALAAIRSLDREDAANETKFRSDLARSRETVTDRRLAALSLAIPAALVLAFVFGAMPPVTGIWVLAKALLLLTAGVGGLGALFALLPNAELPRFKLPDNMVLKVLGMLIGAAAGAFAIGDWLYAHAPTLFSVLAPLAFVSGFALLMKTDNDKCLNLHGFGLFAVGAGLYLSGFAGTVGTFFAALPYVGPAIILGIILYNGKLPLLLHGIGSGLRRFGDFLNRIPLVHAVLSADWSHIGTVVGRTVFIGAAAFTSLVFTSMVPPGAFILMGAAGFVVMRATGNILGGLPESAKLSPEMAAYRARIHLLNRVGAFVSLTGVLGGAWIFFTGTAHAAAAATAAPVAAAVPFLAWPKGKSPPSAKSPASGWSTVIKLAMIPFHVLLELLVAVSPILLLMAIGAIVTHLAKLVGW